LVASADDSVTRFVLIGLVCAASMGLGLTSTAAATPALPMKAAWKAVYSEQHKELSGRYVAPHSGPISFRETYCARRSARKIHCYYATFFNAPDPNEHDEYVDGYACGRSVDVRLRLGKRKPARTVRWQGCEVLRYRDDGF
jgi:hypothetical protein